MAPMSAADVSALASEAQIIADCRSGNAAAWDSLFDKYYATVARFVFQLSGDFSHEDTEEICQETFLSVVQKSIFISGSKLISNLVAADRGEQGDGLSRKNASCEKRWKRGAHLNRRGPN